MSKVEITNNGQGLILKINDLIHLTMTNCVAIHSYIDAEIPNPIPDADKMPDYLTRYYIEFYLASGQTIKAEYDRRDLWEEILKGL